MVGNRGVAQAGWRRLAATPQFPERPADIGPSALRVVIRMHWRSGSVFTLIQPLAAAPVSDWAELGFGCERTLLSR